MYILIFLLTSVLILVFFQILLQQFDRLMYLAMLCGLFIGPIAGYCSFLVESYALPDINSHDSFIQAFQLNDLLLFFFVVGPIEELAKFLAIIPIALRARHFKSRTDILLLGISGACGFAAGENVLYYLQFGWAATWPRLWLGNLGHISYTLFWSYALGAVLIENASASLLATGLLIAAVLHGLYDYSLMLGAFGFLFAMLLALGLSGWVFWLVFKEREQ